MKDMLKKFSRPPIILGGCGRSGTTLLLSILSAHPKIYCIPKETMAFCPTAYSDVYEPIATFEIEKFYNENFSNKIINTFDCWCEKTPKNVLSFSRILDEFNQNAKLIHIVRDGRDTIISKHPTNPKIYWVEPERWISDVNVGLSLYYHPNVYTIKYEDLVLNYEKKIRDICHFIEIEFHDNLLSWFKFAKVRTNHAWFGNVQPLHSNSIGKWKRVKYGRARKRINRLMGLSEATRLLKFFKYI